MRYRTVIARSGPNNTGIPVPDEVVESLGAGKRPPVTVTLNGSYTYRSTVATMDGAFIVSFSKEHREKSGLGGDDEVEVDLVLDTVPREIEVPEDLQAALDAEPEALTFWNTLSFSAKRGHVDPINGAKTPETRQRRIEKSIAKLRERKK